MPQKYPKLISTSSLYRADLNALDGDIKMMEQRMRANPFMPTPENIEMKKLEMEQMKMEHEKMMMEADRHKINNMFKEEEQ